MKHPFALFGLSPSASKVLSAVKDGLPTPVAISNETGISRPAIYAILNQLEEQGLITSGTLKGKRFWHIANPSQINRVFETARSALLGSKEEKELLYEEKNIEVKVYRGKKTIIELMRFIYQEHVGETCIGIQGANVYDGWRDLIGLETIHELNKSIKKHRMIMQVIVPQDHFQRVVPTMGVEWAKHFEGRTTRVNEIDESYFQNKGEMVVFKDSVYLICMEEALVIEIKHSHIQKMLLSLIHYVQDNSRVIDGNQILRELMTAEK
ncbi:MAG: hypothetical protein JWL75_100 [Parcubacteria group bacterium]|nr:hypothetical protein [Parcubacteria group bacterium]